MRLIRISDRILVFPYEKERDRPNLGYIRGDRLVIAVDAGHSRDHTEEFYAALQEEGMRPPDLTILTHWHWDHTFGLHAAHGISIANRRTKEYLCEIRDEIKRDGPGRFFSLHESIPREYEGGKPVIVTLPDILFSGELCIDAGGCVVRLLEAPAPHTDDSTLVLAESEKVLFTGDAASGVFPTWEKDPSLCQKLADVIAATDCDICLESHHVTQTKREMINDLLSTVKEKNREV